MDLFADGWIDPVAFRIFGLPIRWYALAYLTGFVAGWRYAIHLARQTAFGPTPEDMDEFLTWAVIGTILGGRLGYLIYDPARFGADPVQILMIWTGGMSFHGGLTGVTVAMILFARRRGFAFLAGADILAVVAPIGLFFGRIANFVNAELFGRPTDLPWGIVFPGGGDVPRHPSQLYEAFLEGLVLLVVLAVLARRDRIRRRPGMLAGLFLAGYGVVRFLVEFVRQPDAQFVEGSVWLGATMGQLLSLPMIAIGGGVLLWAARRPAVRGA